MRGNRVLVEYRQRVTWMLWCGHFDGSYRTRRFFGWVRQIVMFVRWWAIDVTLM
jgi:hypothetical protein